MKKIVLIAFVSLAVTNLMQAQTATTRKSNAIKQSTQKKSVEADKASKEQFKPDRNIGRQLSLKQEDFQNDDFIRGYSLYKPTGAYVKLESFEAASKDFDRLIRSNGFAPYYQQFTFMAESTLNRVVFNDHIPDGLMYETPILISSKDFILRVVYFMGADGVGKVLSYVSQEQEMSEEEMGNVVKRLINTVGG